MVDKKRKHESSHHDSSHHDAVQETRKKAKSSSQDPLEEKLNKINDIIEKIPPNQEVATRSPIGARGGSPSTSHTNNSSVTDDDIQTPLKSVQPATQPQTPLSTNSTNVSSDSAGRSIMVLETGSGVSAHFDLDGDYVVRVKRSITSSTIECNVKVTKELAQSAGMLAEILRDMGEQLLAQYRTSLQYVMEHSIQN